MSDDSATVWWPDSAVGHTDIVRGTQRHARGEGVSAEHLFTLKQTPYRIIWACACGETYSRAKVRQ